MNLERTMLQGRISVLLRDLHREGIPNLHLVIAEQLC